MQVMRKNQIYKFIFFDSLGRTLRGSDRGYSRPKPLFLKQFIPIESALLDF